MIVLFIDPEVNNPVRINIAIPMTFLALYSYAEKNLKGIEFEYYSLEIDKAKGKKTTFDDINELYKPDIVITTSVSSNFNNALSILKYFKSKGCITFIGGLFSSSNYKWVLEYHNFVDIVFIGEGEKTFCKVIDRIANEKNLDNISGLAYRQKDKIMFSHPKSVINNLDHLPPLNFDKIPVELYKKFDTRYYVFASRGCFYNCNFCTLNSHWGNIHRMYPIERVTDEIKKLVELFNPIKISFGDDALSIDKIFFENLCYELKNRSFPVNFGGKTRIDSITFNQLELMAEAGFNEISFGVESNIPTQLKGLGKTLIIPALENLNNLLSAATNLGFRINLNFILGTIGETEETLVDKARFIIKHCSKSNIIPLLGFLTPHRGTKLFCEKEKLGLILTDDDFDHYNHLQPVCYPSSLGRNGLKILKEAYNLITIETNSQIFNPILEV